VELFSEFCNKLVNGAGINLHFKMLRGGNTHHLLEACFKGFARALDKALKIDQRLGDKALSTKGKLGEGEE
ncbi:MAG: imidazoleglycerol-phosphate dehydratase, partial [Halanaerobiaceae bacterium]